LRPLVHAWANDVIEHFTRIRGVFGSRIAFALSGRKAEIGSIGMDGADMAVLTQMRAPCLLPAYSPTGREIAFTSFLRGTPDLWIVPSSGGRARRVSSRQGLNTGAAWFPDGATLALTLSYQGNPEIYRVHSGDGRVLRQLTHAPGIDTSPSLSSDGSQIAFVSDRQGSPQIFVMSSSGGGARRLTFLGSQNTTPRFSPRPDKPLIAFTGRDERAAFDVFVYDLKAGKIDRITQGQGSNFDPTWSPDGRLLAYASSRGGLFVINPDTRRESQIWKGGARNLSWGPGPR
jgi:TolB protein